MKRTAPSTLAPVPDALVAELEQIGAAVGARPVDRPTRPTTHPTIC